MKNINIFDAKIVLVPINTSGNHWTLAVLINCGSIMEKGKGKPMPCLLYMDSYGNHPIDSTHFDLLLKLLNMQWKIIKKDSSNPFTRRTLSTFNPIGVSSILAILTYLESYILTGYFLASPSASTEEWL